MSCGPQAVESGKFMTEQAGWMNYHAPPDQIVLFQDKITTFPTPPFKRATTADAMRLDDPYLKVMASKDGANYLIGRVNAKLTSFLPAPVRMGFMNSVTRIKPPTPPPPPAVLYCGGRNCAAGERFLVVYCTGLAGPGDDVLGVFALDIEVYEQAKLRRPFHGTASEFTFIGQFPGNDNNSIQIFAGQPDPNDDSRFTIRYIMNGAPSMIEGKLQPDGIGVELRPRGPLFTKPLN
ncbi:MAG TPA: hypothetical protein VFE47_27165 [Tepidisphaeraceae bacterium]|jgi:hypothetical protein|nr:hypothetical protein [Tepidisphaeraceae bacterium]